MNFVIFNDIKNKKLNFKKLLKSNESIEWKNCKNLKIKINSKINKFQFDNCNNITLYLYGTIAGLEINKCNNFKLIIPSNHHITSIQLYKTKIKIKCNKNEFKKIFLIKEQTNILLI